MMERRTGSPLAARRHAPERATPTFLLKTAHRFLRVLATTPKMRRRGHKTHKQKLEAQAQSHDRAMVASSSTAASPSPTGLLDSNKRKQPRQSQAQATPAPNESLKKLRRPGQSQTQIYVGDAQAQAPHDTTALSSDSAASKDVAAGKYWLDRHCLFSLYDRGVRMDAEGWYSVTPEAIAATQASRAASIDLVVDAFAGVGGNTIQFAARGSYVVAVEIDPRKVEFAMHNARIYGVEDRIEFMVGDFLQLAPFLKGDVVFLSPPWGGPSYNRTPIFTLDMLKPKDGYAIFRAAQKIASNIIMFLPRNVDISQVEELSWLWSPPLDYESEKNYLECAFKGITAYFGNTARAPTASSKLRSRTTCGGVACSRVRRRN